MTKYLGAVTIMSDRLQQSWTSILYKSKTINTMRNTRMVSNACCSSGTVLCTDESGVRRITLNNPRHRNILSFEVLTNLRKFLMNVDDRHSNGSPAPIGCVIIDAVGDVFSAGHDLRELTSAKSGGKVRHRELFDLCSDVMLRISDLSVPVLAQVRGHAAAAGFQLVASCDIVVATESASFSTPGINVGLFCSTPAVAIVRALPPKVASYMLHTGIPITAKEAAVYGLVSRLVADDVLEAETTRIANIICEKSFAVQAIGKRCLRRQLAMPIKEAYTEASSVMVDNLAMKDAQSGIQAFLAKRPAPKWSNV